MDEHQNLINGNETSNETSSTPFPLFPSKLLFDFVSASKTHALNIQHNSILDGPTTKVDGEQRLTEGPTASVVVQPPAREIAPLTQEIVPPTQNTLFATKLLDRVWLQKTWNEFVSVAHHTIAASIGNILEWYDLAVYAYFAPEIGENFFSGTSHTTKMLQTFALLSGSFFMRPLGAIVMGHIGDNHGRKAALIISIVILGLPTVVVGCLPTRHTAGVFAPILLSLVRLAQGVSVGGEMAGAYLCAVESAPQNRKAFMSAVCECSGAVGMMMGSAVAGTIRSVMSVEAMFAWGWRIPFLLSIFVAVLGWNVRRCLPESPSHLDAESAYQSTDPSHVAGATTTSLRHVLKHHWLGILLLAGVVSFDASLYCTTFVWLANFVTDLSDDPIGQEAFAANTMVFIPLLLSSLTFGKLADVIGYHKVMLCTVLSLVFFGPFAFAAVETNTLMGFAVGQMILALIVGAYTGPLGARMVAFFPPNVRYTAIGIGFNLSQSVLGGTMPVVATLLAGTSLGLTAVSLMLSSIAFLAVLSLEAMRKIEKRRILVVSTLSDGTYGEMS